MVSALRCPYSLGAGRDFEDGGCTGGFDVSYSNEMERYEGVTPK